MPPPNGTLALGDDHELDLQCAATHLTGPAGQGFAPVAATTATAAAQCTALWEARRQAEGSPVRAWYRMRWDDLTAEDVELWHTVGGGGGVLPNPVEAAWRRLDAKATAAGTWEAFSEHVILDGGVETASPWSDVYPVSTSAQASYQTKRAALAQLGFSSDTWGRQWAMLENIFYPRDAMRQIHGGAADAGILAEDVKVVLEWAELTQDERQALNQLGYMEGNAWDDGNPNGQALSSRAWHQLSGEEHAALNKLRVAQSHWDRTMEAAKRAVLKGCFWHRGLGRARFWSLDPRGVAQTRELAFFVSSLPNGA